MPSQTPAHTASDFPDASCPESCGDESEPNDKPGSSEADVEFEPNNRPTSQRIRKTVTFLQPNKSGAAPRPGRSRPVAWDEGLTEEYQEVPRATRGGESQVVGGPSRWGVLQSAEEVPPATLGREPQVARGPSQWEVFQSALDEGPYQQEVPPDDRWDIPESAGSRRNCQKKGSKPLKYFSVLSNHTPNSQKLLKISNECFRKAVAGQVTFPTDEELEKLSEKCFDKGLATFKKMDANAPGKYSSVDATVAFHIHHIAQ